MRLAGRIATEPTLGATKDGRPWTTFRLAVHDRSRNADGGWGVIRPWRNHATRPTRLARLSCSPEKTPGHRWCAIRDSNPEPAD
jgi:hypothetical protein